MSPTLDENATSSDPRVQRDHRAALLFAALHRAIELDGLPAPLSVTPGVAPPANLQLASVADVDDWSVRLGVDRAPDLEPIGTPPWREYHAIGAIEGIAVEVWCSVDAEETLAEQLDQLDRELARLRELDA